MLIRELVTHLGFDVDFEPLDQFDDKVKDTQENLHGLGAAADESIEQIKGALTKLRNLLLGMTVAAGATGAGIAAIVKTAADAGDEIANTAPLLGMTAEEFQKYRYAANLAGVANEEFVASTQFLLRNIGDAKAGTATAIQAFQRLGISVGQLRGRSTAEVYGLIADKLSAIHDPALRASISVDILGRSGARMGGLLAKGRGEMEALMGDVEAFGMFTNETAQAGDDLNDSLDRVLFFFRGIKNELGQGLFPIFKKVLDDFREWLTLHRETIKAGLAKAIEFLTSVISKAWEMTKRIVKGFETVIHAMGGIRNAAWLVAIALGALFLPLLGPLFIATRGLMMLVIPFFRLHTLISLVTFALGAMMPLWTLFISICSALVANQIIGWLIRLAGGYRALASAIIIPTAALIAQAAALAAVFLLAEDFGEWISGGKKTLIGEWLGSIEEIPNRLRKVWEEIKAVFKEGGAFIAAVFRGDFKEASRLLTDLSKPVIKAAVAPIQAFGADAPGFQAGAAGWGGMAPAYTFAGHTPVANNDLKSQWAGMHTKFKTAYTLGAPDENGDPRIIPAGGGRQGVQIHAPVKVDVTLPKGTPAEHAQEIAEHVDRAIQRQVEHSLQQTTPPGS